MATVRCPSCERALEVEDAYRDWTVRCPHCDNEFVPGAVEPGPRPRPVREEPDDRDDDEDDDARDEFRSSARREARQIVAAPATALEVVGWMSALAALGLCGLFLVLAVEANNNPNQNANDEDEVGFMLIGMCSGVLGVPYGVAMAVGARKMRDLSSRGWALTAGILGVASFAIFGVCGIFQVGFGIWALVALENPAVRAAFGANSRWRSRRDWD